MKAISSGGMSTTLRPEPSHPHAENDCAARGSNLSSFSNLFGHPWLDWLVEVEARGDVFGFTSRHG